jgi:hypothetical protein
LDFPEPNVYLIRAYHKPPSQHTTQNQQISFRTQNSEVIKQLNSNIPNFKAGTNNMTSF